MDHANIKAMLNQNKARKLQSKTQYFMQTNTEKAFKQQSVETSRNKRVCDIISIVKLTKA